MDRGAIQMRGASMLTEMAEVVAEVSDVSSPRPRLPKPIRTAAGCPQALPAVDLAPAEV
jgi:hypothetical protein